MKIVTDRDLGEIKKRGGKVVSSKLPPGSGDYTYVSGDSERKTIVVDLLRVAIGALMKLSDHLSQSTQLQQEMLQLQKPKSWEFQIQRDADLNMVSLTATEKRRG